MATTQQPVPVAVGPKTNRPALRVVPDDAAIDVRHFARQYVAVLLEIEGVQVTPSTESPEAT
jgi:hypothetical protein